MKTAALRVRINRIYLNTQAAHLNVINSDMTHNGSLGGQAASRRGMESPIHDQPPQAGKHCRRASWDSESCVSMVKCFSMASQETLDCFLTEYLKKQHNHDTTSWFYSFLPEEFLTKLPITFKRVHHLRLNMAASLSSCSCSHSLGFVPFPPSAPSCSNWMCSRCISSQLLAAVGSNSAHAAFRTSRCCSISCSSVLTRWGKKKWIFVPRACTIKTGQDILLLLPLSLYIIYQTVRSEGSAVCRNTECLSKENCLLGRTCLSRSVFSAWRSDGLHRSASLKWKIWVLFKIWENKSEKIYSRWSSGPHAGLFWNEILQSWLTLIVEKVSISGLLILLPLCSVLISTSSSLVLLSGETPRVLLWKCFIIYLKTFIAGVKSCRFSVSVLFLDEAGRKWVDIMWSSYLCRWLSAVWCLNSMLVHFVNSRAPGWMWSRLVIGWLFCNSVI